MLTNRDLISIGDDALTEAYASLAVRTGTDMIEFPPSSLLACLMAHAKYEGWDFDMAVAVAKKHGPADATQIANGETAWPPEDM